MTGLLVLTWVRGYVEASAAVAEACGGRPSFLGDLDAAVSELEEATEFGGGSLDVAIPRVGQQLRSTAAQLGMRVTEADSCDDLTSGLSASWVLAGGDWSEGFFPKFTLRNEGDETVVVELEGEGRASNEYGRAYSMSWGGYSDSRVVVPPGKERVRGLGGNTGETLYVGPGQRVLELSMRAAAFSEDAALGDCPVRLTRAR